MENVVSLVNKEPPEAIILVSMLRNMIADIESGKVRAVSFVALKIDNSLTVGSEVVTDTCTLTMLGSIRSLEQWYMDTRLRDILSEA